MHLPPDHAERYARHIVLPEIGGPGQLKLLNASVAIVGLGGLGGPAALYLAASGVGTLRLIEHDNICLSNLHRQILFDTNSVGTPKIQTASDTLNALNPNCRILTYQQSLNSHNAAELLADASVILDCSDNFDTRFAVNTAAITLKRPLISAAVGRWQTQLCLFDLADPNAPCYRCLVPQPPENTQDCTSLGIPGPLAGIPGAHMALETIKYITNAGQSLAGRLLLFDGLTSCSRIIHLKKDPLCQHCPDPANQT